MSLRRWEELLPGLSKSVEYKGASFAQLVGPAASLRDKISTPVAEIGSFLIPNPNERSPELYRKAIVEEIPVFSP